MLYAACVYYARPLFFKKKFVKMEDKFTQESSDYVMLSGGDNENSQKNQ